MSLKNNHSLISFRTSTQPEQASSQIDSMSVDIPQQEIPAQDALTPIVDASCRYIQLIVAAENSKKLTQQDYDLIT